VAIEYGADVPFLRPAELATDDCRIEGALRHALEWAEHQEQAKYDMVCLLQNSSPLRTGEDIDWCVRLLSGHLHDADSVASTYLAEHEHPLMAKKLNDDGYLVPFGEYDPALFRRQDQPPVYYMNGAVYVVNRDYLMEHGRVIGKRCLQYVMSHYRSIDVHYAEDIPIVETVMGMSSGC
jgi:CMP-N-acetylneuraminic acid synthetase